MVGSGRWRALLGALVVGVAFGTAVGGRVTRGTPLRAGAVPLPSPVRVELWPSTPLGGSAVRPTFLMVHRIAADEDELIDVSPVPDHVHPWKIVIVGEGGNRVALMASPAP